jgi:uncharacterized protein YdgA (DUF945 family)
MFTSEIVSYERGWYQSQARLEFGLSEIYLEQLGAARGDSEMLVWLTQRIPVIVDIVHGPVTLAGGLNLGMARVTARPDPASPTVAQIEQLLGLPYLFEFRGRAGFGTGFEFDADVPPVDYAGPTGEIDFSGFDLTGTIDGPVLDIQGGADRLEYQSPFAAGIASAIALTTKYEFRPDRLPISRSSFEIEQLTVTSPLTGGAPLFDLTSLTLASQFVLDASSERLNGSVTYSADAVAAGEYFSMNDARVGLALNGIDAAVVADYYAVVQNASAAGAIDPDQLLAELEPLLDRLVRAGFDFDLEPMRFSMPDGAFDAEVHIGIDGASLPPGQLADPRNIAVLFGVLSADAEFRITKPLTERLVTLGVRTQMANAAAAGGQPMSDDELNALAQAQTGFMLVGLIGQGMIVDDGSDYTSTVQFSAGEVSINGAPMPGGLF